MVKNYQSYLSETGCIRSTGGIVIARTLLRGMGTVISRLVMLHGNHTSVISKPLLW